MRLRRLILISVFTLLGLIVIAPLTWLARQHIGPCVLPPTEDPVDRQNIAFNNLSANAATHYAAAFEALLPPRMKSGSMRSGHPHSRYPLS